MLQSGAPTAKSTILGVPKFDAKTAACKNFTGEKSITNKDGKTTLWKTHATPSASDKMTLSLLNKNGSQKDTFMYTLVVVEPSGSADAVNSMVRADQWSNLSFPKDFGAHISVLQKGTYTLLYEVNGKAIACDGFVL